MSITSEYIPSEAIKDQFSTNGQYGTSPKEQKTKSIVIISVSLFWYVAAFIFSIIIYLPFAKSFFPTEAAQYIILLPFSIVTPIYFVFFVWQTQIRASVSLAKRWAKILTFSVPTICLTFFILTFWLSDRPCESIVCMVVPLIIASAFFWTLITAAIVPVAAARLLVKEPCDFKVFFIKSIMFGVPTLLLLSGVWSFTSPRYEMLGETLRRNVRFFEQEGRRLKQLKSHGIFLDLKPALLPKGVSKTFNDRPTENDGIMRSYQCLKSATTALSIAQYPRSQQGIIDEDGGRSYEIRKREFTVADKQGMLYEKFFSRLGHWPADGVGKLFSREIIFYTDSLQIVVFNDQTELFCPLSEEKFVKIVQSIIADLPLLPLPSPAILKTDETYENQVYKFRFLYPAKWSVIEPPPSFGLLNVIITNARDPRDFNVYNPVIVVRVIPEKERELLRLESSDKVEVTKQKELTVGGQQATSYLVKLKNGKDFSVFSNKVIIQTNRFFYTIENQETDLPAANDAFDKIIESFEFT